MFIWGLSWRNVKNWAMLSIAVVTLNVLAVKYYSGLDNLETVNMSTLSGHVIAIDPGHGGIDGGASRQGVVEKKVTLDIANKLARILQENGAQVTLTRNADIDYYTTGKGGKRNDLLKRVDIIQSSGAEVFISIHCNAINIPSLSGAQVFYNPKRAENEILAKYIQQALKEFPPGNKRQAKEDFHILLLNANSMNGVLVEVGYLTNKEEASLLIDSTYQQKLAEQIAKGIAYHFSQSVGR